VIHLVATVLGGPLGETGMERPALVYGADSSYVLEIDLAGDFPGAFLLMPQVLLCTCRCNVGGDDDAVICAEA